MDVWNNTSFQFYWHPITFHQWQIVSARIDRCCTGSNSVLANSEHTQFCAHVTAAAFSAIQCVCVRPVVLFSVTAGSQAVLWHCIDCSANSLPVCWGVMAAPWVFNNWRLLCTHCMTRERSKGSTPLVHHTVLCTEFGGLHLSKHVLCCYVQSVVILFYS